MSYICIYIYMYISKQVYFPIFIYIFINKDIYTHKCTYVYLYMCVCLHTYICIYKYIYTYIYMYIYMYICMCIYTYEQSPRVECCSTANIRQSTPVQERVSMHPSHMHTHTHTHTRTLTHTPRNDCKPSCTYIYILTRDTVCICVVFCKYVSTTHAQR